MICDEDGLYDPADFNDRLLLGLKGTMSEAELHFIRARLQGGILSKARRGELPMPLPVGLVRTRPGRSCSTRTPPSSTRSGTCLTRLRVPVPRALSSSRSTVTACCFPHASDSASAKVS